MKNENTTCENKKIGYRNKNRMEVKVKQDEINHERKINEE